MTPLRAEEITLFCEDAGGGRSQRLLNAAALALVPALPFATIVRAVGVASKNDVQVRTKFARMDTKPTLRVFGVRDRDFLPRPLVDSNRARAFARTPNEAAPWPLPRHCIESYLLDDEVLERAALGVPLEDLRALVEKLAAARLWLDVTRGTLEDLAFRLRRIRQGELEGRPADRAEAIRAALEVARRMKGELDVAGSEESLSAHMDALSADMVADGSLRFRVDGRELIYALEGALGREKGTLLTKLDAEALRLPPGALIADLREVLETMPPTWRVFEG